jgi:acyl-CoA reductase-like NAD-dependent aldehyde dehydrogenase
VSVAVAKHQNFVGGEWIDATGGETMEVLNPAAGETIAEVPRGFWNSGQDCTAASRVVAGPKIYDRLLEEFVPAVESLHVGDPWRATRSRWGR